MGDAADDSITTIELYMNIDLFNERDYPNRIGILSRF